MRKEGYVTRISCDCPTHRRVGTTVDTVTGKSKRDVDLKLRLAGWVRIKGHDICHACKVAARTAKSITKEIA